MWNRFIVLRAICPPYLCLGMLCGMLCCCSCALGLCQLLRFRCHLTLGIANLLLQVVHDHLFACQSGLCSSCSGSCILSQAILCLESCLPACHLLVLDRGVGLVSCSLGDGHQAAADTVSHAVAVATRICTAPVVRSEAVFISGGPQVSKVVLIFVAWTFTLCLKQLTHPSVDKPHTYAYVSLKNAEPRVLVASPAHIEHEVDGAQSYHEFHGKEISRPVPGAAPRSFCSAMEQPIPGHIKRTTGDLNVLWNCRTASTWLTKYR